MVLRLAQLGWQMELKGLWQIGEGYDPDPKKQALAVYKTYTSNDTDYGCLSSWCAVSGCGEAIEGIGQDAGTTETFQRHRFCRGVWTGDSSVFLRAAIALGGSDYLAKIGKVCSGAARREEAQRKARRHRRSEPNAEGVL